MSQPYYMKDVKKSTFALEWIPFLIVDVSINLCGCILAGIALEILFTREFIMRDYFYEEGFLFAIIVLSFLLSIRDYFKARKIYRIIKEKPFALIDDKKLVLCHGIDSFSWEHVKDVVVEGGRKVVITFTEEGEQKKKVNDLKWVTGKDDFIQSLKKACNERNISYRESEMTLSSWVGLSLRMMKRLLLENLPERKKEYHKCQKGEKVHEVP
ncbi:MAG: hypothetical protein HXS41_09100 [Theionarchaea archaeon]|nr:hypothetical protein [Theionarchaea archaeon]